MFLRCWWTVNRFRDLGLAGCLRSLATLNLYLCYIFVPRTQATRERTPQGVEILPPLYLQWRTDRSDPHASSSSRPLSPVEACRRRTPTTSRGIDRRTMTEERSPTAPLPVVATWCHPRDDRRVCHFLVRQSRDERQRATDRRMGLRCCGAHDLHPRWAARTATRIVYLDAILYLDAGIVSTGQIGISPVRGTLNSGARRLVLGDGGRTAHATHARRMGLCQPPGSPVRRARARVRRTVDVGDPLPHGGRLLEFRRRWRLRLPHQPSDRLRSRPPASRSQPST